MDFIGHFQVRSPFQVCGYGVATGVMSGNGRGRVQEASVGAESLNAHLHGVGVARIERE